MELVRRLNGLVARTVPVRTARLRAGRPVASVTFDDFPKSAWTNGGPILARYGARATYYAAGSFCGRTADGTEFYNESDLRDLHAQGHEIGCHGFSHEPGTALTSAALNDDVSRNGAFLKPFLAGAAPVSYAFPFGAVSLRSKRLIAHRFSTARGVHPGVNVGTIDLAQLRAVSLERQRWDEDALSRAISIAKRANGWIIFTTHEISHDADRFGSTPAMLDHVLKMLAEARIDVLPVREAMAVAMGDVR